jgi:hypothetical protein
MKDAEILRSISDPQTGASLHPELHRIADRLESLQADIPQTDSQEELWEEVRKTHFSQWPDKYIIKRK